jgi:hypothetical protein
LLTTSPSGEHSLKGLDDPVPVFRLKGLREAAAESRPLVGRRAELAQCRSALAAIADGQAGAVIVVRGEPGIGKTRFIEELQSPAAPQFCWSANVGQSIRND